jgi:hypothetical protein
MYSPLAARPYRTPRGYAYDYSPARYYGHHQRQRPHDYEGEYIGQPTASAVEEATRKHVKATSEFEKSKETFEKARKDYEEKKEKVKEAERKLREAKRGGAYG